jgi:hypothetical protein
MKIAKDNIAGRHFASGFPDLAPSRGRYAETEPVHALVADREAMPHGQFAAARNGSRENSGGAFRRTLGHAPPTGVERRQCDRRRRQVDVLLDTRVMPSRRRRQSVDEEA